jgi:hypothetical protein
MPKKEQKRCFGGKILPPKHHMQGKPSMIMPLHTVVKKDSAPKQFVRE